MPKSRRVEAASIDIVELHDNIRIAEVELLVEIMYLSNKFGPICSHVNSHCVVTL